MTRLTLHALLLVVAVKWLIESFSFGSGTSDYCCCDRARLTVPVLKRSILIEKVARRSYQVAPEYEVDPLESLFVRDLVAHLDEPQPPPPHAWPLPQESRVHQDDTPHGGVSPGADRRHHAADSG